MVALPGPPIPPGDGRDRSRCRRCPEPAASRRRRSRHSASAQRRSRDKRQECCRRRNPPQRNRRAGPLRAHHVSSGSPIQSRDHLSVGLAPPANRASARRRGAGPATSAPTSSPGHRCGSWLTRPLPQRSRAPSPTHPACHSYDAGIRLKVYRRRHKSASRRSHDQQTYPHRLARRTGRTLGRGQPGVLEPAWPGIRLLLFDVSVR